MCVRGTFLAVGLAVLAETGAAEEFDFLKPEAVRAAYVADRAGWEEVPPMVVQAFVLAEDKRFWEKSAFRSTVTQNIGRWYPETSSVPRTPHRATTLAGAQALEHEEIADWFVNRVFLGRGCFGVAGAAEAYFGKPVAALAVQEVAYLAILPKGPADLHPVRAKDKAVERRNWLLGEMVEAGLLADEVAGDAKGMPLGVRKPLGTCDVK